MDVEKISQKLKAAGSKISLSVLLLLYDTEEASLSEIAELLQADRQLVSHHIQRLVYVGLLNKQRRGRKVFYKLTDDAFDIASISIQIGRRVK